MIWKCIYTSSFDFYFSHFLKILSLFISTYDKIHYNKKKEKKCFKHYE